MKESNKGLTPRIIRTLQKKSDFIGVYSANGLIGQECKRIRVILTKMVDAAVIFTFTLI